MGVSIPDVRLTHYLGQKRVFDTTSRPHRADQGVMTGMQTPGRVWFLEDDKANGIGARKRDLFAARSRIDGKALVSDER